MSNIGFTPSAWRLAFCAPYDLVGGRTLYCQCLAGENREKVYYDGRGNCVMCSSPNQFYDYQRNMCVFPTERLPGTGPGKVAQAKESKKVSQGYVIRQQTPGSGAPPVDCPFLQKDDGQGGCSPDYATIGIGVVLIIGGIVALKAIKK